MTHATKRWLSLFPRAWRARYGGELSGLVEDLQNDDDLRASDRVDMLRSGLAIRQHSPGRPSPRSLRAAVGMGTAALCAVAGLALA
ncbi:MAG: hypothetical protein ACRDZ5_04130, partial [Acidimicrobiales bacterium]